ncbi:hypothetical protein [Campylobacter concisus]|nr:hypothetical protein [Campylobacter concisus]
MLEQKIDAKKKYSKMNINLQKKRNFKNKRLIRIIQKPVGGLADW